MFSDLREAIKVCLLLEEEETNREDKDEDEDAYKASERCKTILKRVDTSTWERYQSIYHYVQEYAPYLIELMMDKKWHQDFDALIAEMGKAMQKVWSDDASQLKRVHQQGDNSSDCT
ncbi:hypothetical protein SCLCIDRAFT_23319 [Scleroderma citrinum Foug A]|uniref:Uncharacterized protein n=1 Tax=Scleroderma citrinum Foug A TaxID=1036808 RepID=A0A0C3AI50_9AGAM|nr:hypothetical protein SCLCIDRAFT_23319 [Scleroderma citrinum Foug A]